ncbi:MAG: hypothetical protein V1867_00845 [Candidatus Falkowbacteria bacterium]
MATALVLKERNIFESKIAAAIEKGRYDLVIEDRGGLCAVHAEEGLAYEYLLDLFSGFDPVPLPERDANGWRAFLAATGPDELLKLLGDDFSVVIDGFMHVIIPGAVVALGPPMNWPPLTQRAINMHRFAFEDARKYQEGLEEW